MACADGGEQKEQKPDGSQLAVPDGLLDAASLATTRAPVPDGPQVEPHEGGQEVRSGSQLPLSDGPERFTIGTKKAFAENRAYPYEKKEIAGEIVYFCNRGSQWSRPDEILALRRDDGNWTAFDSAFLAGGDTLECRQRVFRCLGKDTTQSGWYKWQTNGGADARCVNAEGWSGNLWAQTVFLERVFC